MLQILPFNEFWYDCFVNNRISYLNSVNTSYHNMMYINDYKYFFLKFEGTDDIYISIKFLEGENSQKFLSNLKIIEKNYKSSVNYMDEIREMITDGVTCCPKVDLFIWNKWGKGYQKWKSYHYTMLISYKSDLKEYTALEDDRFGKYMIISQSEKDLDDSVKSVKKWCNRGLDYLIFECDKIIPNYQYNLNELIGNIEQINDSIKHILKYNFFDYKSEINQIPGNMEFQAISISKIMTKMEVNKIFVGILYNRKLLNEEIFIKTDKLFLELRNSYEIMKNVLLKCRLKKLNEFVKVEGQWLNKQLKNNLNCEYKIWNIIKKELIRVNNNVIIF